MTRIGQKPIQIPKGVEVKVTGSTVFVKGPKGTLEQTVDHGVTVEIQEGLALVKLEKGASENRAFQGLYRSIIQNMVNGVSSGFSVVLEIVGVGYRAAVDGKTLNLQLGFSHPTAMPIPSWATVTVEKNTIITISGCDKREVGQFAAQLSALRPPEPYQGKGIRKRGQYVRKKAGKTAAK